MRILLVSTLLSVVAAFSAFSQSERLLEQIRGEEKDAIEAIALYPEEERTMILEASSHPEVLVRLQNMQAKTASDFRILIGNLSTEDQQKVFNISRFPVLMDLICANDKKNTQRRMEQLLEDYPTDIAADAYFLNDNYFGLLVKVNALYAESDRAFKDAISYYTPDIQTTYQRLIKLPEVMSVMSNNLNMTVLLGDLYRNNPEQVKKELDSLNIVVAEQKAKDLKEWKESLENDPEAMAEYEKASQEFAGEHGYTASDYSGTRPDRYQTDIYVNNAWVPYPYWFGCPRWYSPYECWYPYPWWYHWGFYYGPGNTIIIIGMPSFYYMNWCYSYDYFYYYPRFINVVFNYHQKHPNSISTVNLAADNWVRDHQDKLPKDWLKNDDMRIERIREYGKFNMDYQASIKDGTNQIPSQRDFLKDHSKEYPSLKPVLTEHPDAYKKSEPVQQRIQPIQKETGKPVKKPYEPKPKVVQQPRTNQEVLKRAKTHHENTWKRPTQPSNPRPVSRPPVKNVPKKRH